MLGHIFERVFKQWNVDLEKTENTVRQLRAANSFCDFVRAFGMKERCWDRGRTFVRGIEELKADKCVREFWIVWEWESVFDKESGNGLSGKIGTDDE